MGVAEIAAIPHSAQDLSSWSLSHAANHVDIIRAINARQAAAHTTLTRFSSFVMDPFDPRDMNTWLWQHQTMHNEMDKTLNIQGFDLNSLDWHDENSVADWFNQHADEHVRACQILGLG